MNLAVITLLALIVAIVIGCVKPKMNTGIIAITLALVIGVYSAQLPLKTITAGFPADLFLMLVSICLLFSMAAQNGTLEKLSRFFIRSVKGNPKLFPLLFFFLTFFLSAIGPGNIAATAFGKTVLLIFQKLILREFFNSLTPLRLPENNARKTNATPINMAEFAIS